MIYTKEHIEEYKEIFLKYKKQLEEPLLKEVSIYPTCVNPDCNTNQQGMMQPPNFYVESGFYMCESCGYYDNKEY